MLNPVRGVLVLPAPFPPPRGVFGSVGSFPRGPSSATPTRTPRTAFAVERGFFRLGSRYIEFHCDLHRNGGPAAVLTDSGMMHQSGTMRSFDDSLMFESIKRWPMIVMDFERAV